MKTVGCSAMLELYVTRANRAVPIRACRLGWAGQAHEKYEKLTLLKFKYPHTPTDYRHTDNHLKTGFKLTLNFDLDQ